MLGWSVRLNVDVPTERCSFLRSSCTSTCITSRPMTRFSTNPFIYDPVLLKRAVVEAEPQPRRTAEHVVELAVSVELAVGVVDGHSAAIKRHLAEEHRSRLRVSDGTLRTRGS